MNGLPVLTIDLDGVICSPPLGINLGISQRFFDADAPPRPARVPVPWVRRIWDPLRFEFRRPLPEAWAALGLLREVREVVVLTGRRSSPEPWLRRHRLLPLIDRVIVNDTALRSAPYKLQMIESLHAVEHIDDDGRTAQLLATQSEAQVYLRDWPRNRGAAYDARIVRVPDLFQLALLLRAGTPGDDSGTGSTMR